MNLRPYVLVIGATAIVPPTAFGLGYLWFSILTWLGMDVPPAAFCGGMVGFVVLAAAAAGVISQLVDP